MNFSILILDIQSNLIDSRIGRHQATYIPVSNPLLKNSFTRAQTPTAAPRPVSLFNRFLHERPSAAAATVTATAPDEKNTTLTQNITSLRYKRDLLDSTTTTPGDDPVRTTESTPSTSQTIVNESNNETSDSNGSDSKETASDGSHPRFHVTYWMFYPYSQVNQSHHSIVTTNFFKKLN